MLGECKMIEIKKKNIYRIDMEYSDFKQIMTPKECEFTGIDLIYAIVTCGVLAKLKEQDKEFKYKKYAIECQLKENGGQLYLSDEYKNFDPSEKVCLSYYRGMIFGRLIAYKCFGMEYFVHMKNFIKKYPNAIGRKNGTAKKQQCPDIVGWNKQQQYFIWECKGYFQGLKKGKTQAQAVANINNNKVNGNFVSAVYAKGTNQNICGHVKDPEVEGKNLELDIDFALQNYYEPIVELIKCSEEHSKIDGMEMGKVEVGSETYWFGLPSEIFQFFDEKLPNNMKGSLKDIVMECAEKQFEDTEKGKKKKLHSDYMYSDCIYIK